MRPSLKLVWRFRDFREGRREGYPLCCVLRFALAWETQHQAVRRGVRWPGCVNAHVPCGWRHHGLRWVDVQAASYQG